MVTSHLPFPPFIHAFIYSSIQKILIKPTIWQAPCQVLRIQTGKRHSLWGPYPVHTWLKEAETQEFGRTHHRKHTSQVQTGFNWGLPNPSTPATPRNSHHKASLGTQGQNGQRRPFPTLPTHMCLVPITSTAPWSSGIDQEEEMIPTSTPPLPFLMAPRRESHEDIWLLISTMVVKAITGEKFLKSPRIAHYMLMSINLGEVW